jgi:branched-chain amino acid aminotransferase
MDKKLQRQVYYNGIFVDESEAKISIYDSALMFGDMVFEMTRSFNGKQWKLRRHLERLYSGIKILRIPIELSIDEMEKAVLKTIEVNEPLFEKDDEHRIMIDISRGLLSLYHGIPNIHKGSNIIIADFPLRWTVQNCSHLYDTGINLHVTSQRAIPSQLMEPKIKNRSRLFYLMANIEASMVEGEDVWALLLDVNGHIAEGTGSNFFMIKNNKIFTPKGKDILRGITMETIVNEIAPSLGIEVIEKDIEPFDVYESDECFLTSTPFCVLPCVTLNKLKIGNGKPGRITNNLLKKWGENVNLDIVGQIKKWDEKNLSKNSTTPYKFGKFKNNSIPINIDK